jgi:serine protein kinase
MAKKLNSTLHHHMSEVKAGKRRFENAFQGVARMILDSDIGKVTVNGKSTYDFSIFRTGNKHVIGMYEEINSFVSYVKDASEGGSSKEMAYVLVGEPGVYLEDLDSGSDAGGHPHNRNRAFSIPA